VYHEVNVLKFNHMPKDLRCGPLELSELKIINKEDRRRYITRNRISGHLLKVLNLAPTNVTLTKNTVLLHPEISVRIFRHEERD
jgi:hypothetical protein